MKWLRPSIAVFCVALLASLCIHFPIYEALGMLAEALLHAPPSQKSTTVEFELAPLVDKGPEDPAAQDIEAKPQAEEPPERRAVDEAQVQAQAKAEPATPVEPEVVPAVPVPVPQIQDNPLAVTQRSDDPNAPPPDQARFIAEENRRVEEETIARVRNMHRDDPEPTPSVSASQAENDVGDAEQDEVADLQNLEGSEERTPTETEAAHAPEDESQPSAGERESEAVSRAAESAPARATEVAPQRASGSPETGGEPETIVVEDGVGSFRIRKLPKGRGPGEKGGDEQPGTPSDQRNRHEGSRAQAGTGTSLRMTWSQFEAAFGADELREQREAYIAQRKSRVQGQDRQRQWRKFRAAIENFVPNVQPGEQTALNTAASPFANYLATVHRRIHREFAHRFLANLPIAGGPFGDRTLNATLEIVINGDGTLHQVGITQTSGFLPFDYGAFNAVERAAPYPAPPRKILSGDGRVYVHWGFYRNERQCGTFNARPFILPHPGDTPAPGQGPLHDSDEPPREDTDPALHDLRDGELGRIPPDDGIAPALRGGATALMERDARRGRGR
jgi:TonB family protein